MKIFTSTTKAFFLSLFTGVVFFCLYWTTLNDGFFPGEAARQASIAMRMERGSSSTQFRQVEEHYSRAGEGGASLSVRDNVITYVSKGLVWRLAGMAVSDLPFGNPAQKLNAFSALCGALSAMLAFVLCRTLLLFLSFHVCPLSARLRKKAATVSAIAGAVALCTSAPFWLASTRFLPQSFETMLMLFAAWMLLDAAVHHREWQLAIFGAIIGMLVFETETNVFLLPLWIFFAVRAMLSGDLCDARGWACLLIGLVLGIIGYIGLSQFMLAREGIGIFIPIKELLISTKVFRSLLLGGSLFEDQPRIVCLCFAIIPFIAAAAMSIWRSNEDAGSSGGFLLFILACMIAIGGSGLRISPWGVYSETDGAILPTTIYLMIAYVAAYLAGQGLLMAGGRFFSAGKVRRRRPVIISDDEGDNRSEEHRDYPVGRILSAFVIVFVFAMAAWNYRIVSDWRDPMADKFASALIERVGTCTWFASSNGLIDSQIRVHARLAEKRLSVICTADPDVTLPRLARAITRDEAFRGLATGDLRGALISTNTDLFLSKWISSDTNICDKLMLADSSGWEAASKPFVPAIAGYKAVRDASAIDWEAVAKDHLAFWKEIADLGPLGPRAPLWLRQDRAALRQQASGIGQLLAARLSAASKTDLAREVLDASEKIRDEPVSARKQYNPYDIY
jgi:hypothetical protein